VGFGEGVLVAIVVGLGDGEGVKLGSCVGLLTAVGGSVGINTCSLLCTLLGFKTMARIQPAVTRMITRIAIGNHSCLILFTRKLDNPENIKSDIHFYLMPSRDFSQPQRKIIPVFDYTSDR
jgi:hypothetical protein